MNISPAPLAFGSSRDTHFGNERRDRHAAYIAAMLVLSVTPPLRAAADAPKPPPPSAKADDRVPLRDGGYIWNGMSRAEVQAALGKPPTTLSADVWVYWDFESFTISNAGRNDTLVIWFTAERVSLIRLLPAAPVRSYVAQQKA